MTNAEKILDYLQNNAVGRENSRLSREVEAAAGVCNREVRQAVNTLRMDGYPICSNGSGYYMAKSVEEVNDCLVSLSYRIAGLENAKAGLAIAKSKMLREASKSGRETV